MQHYTPTNNRYNPAPNLGQRADLSFLSGAAVTKHGKSSYHLNATSQTTYDAGEGFIETLSGVVIGSGNRYQNIDDLIQNVFATLLNAKAVNAAHASPRWLVHVNQFESKIDMLTIAETIETLADSLQAAAEDVDFGLVDRKAPNPRHLVALLRTSFAYRHRVKGWAQLRDFALTYIDSLGLESKRVMKGLED